MSELKARIFSQCFNGLPMVSLSLSKAKKFNAFQIANVFKDQLAKSSILCGEKKSKKLILNYSEN